MEAMDYWRFCDELTVVQAALLAVNEDPGQEEPYIDDREPHKKPVGYVAVLSALQHAILSDRLVATRVSVELDYQHPHVRHPIHSVDWHATRIVVNDLKAWLMSRGVSTGFFFPEGPVLAEYLDEGNECYAPKLAAAVEAWRAVRIERDSKPSPRSVKQDLTRWLNLHAARFGLANEEGEPNKQAVEEVAKVANWDTKGGAPRTPQSV